MAAVTPEPVTRLIEAFAQLPGIGPKTASRLTFYLLRRPAEQAESLAAALHDLKQKTVFCSVCFNITEQSPCAVCRDEGRDGDFLLGVGAPRHKDGRDREDCDPFCLPYSREHDLRSGRGMPWGA